VLFVLKIEDIFRKKKNQTQKNRNKLFSLDVL